MATTMRDRATFERGSVEATVTWNGESSTIEGLFDPRSPTVHEDLRVVVATMSRWLATKRLNARIERDSHKA